MADGLDFSQAHGTAWLEHRMKIWEERWGQNFWVLLYGDFKPPSEEIRVDDLDIIIHPEPIEESVVSSSATCVLKATILIEELSVQSILDAIKRINILLGSWTLVTWGNGGCRWWSWLTHDFGSAAIEPIAHNELEKVVKSVINLPDKVKDKVTAALYWIRESKSLVREFGRSDLLRSFVGYWNAFECLVDAVNIISPQAKLTRSEKQSRLTDFFSQIEGSPKPSDIIEAYKIIDPGFRPKAEHALRVCFGEDAQSKIDECFNQESKADNLYQIRNSINHGDIDSENIEELIRIRARLNRLWEIVWGMFGRLVEYGAPAV